MATQKTKAKAKTARGKERIQQLTEAFPEIPRSLVVKVDLLREGIRPNETTRRLGRWALPEAPWYFEYSMESVHSAAEMAEEGYLRSPLVGHFPDGVSWQFLWDSKSPYDVRYEGWGRYRLYRDDDPVEEAFFPTRPQWYSQKTSSGRPLGTVLQQRGEDALWVAALTYCEYFKDDSGCRYCNIVPSETVRKEQGIERLTAKQQQDLREAFIAAAQEGYARGARITMSGGVLLNVSKEAEMYARIAKVLRRAMKEVGQECPITACMQAPAREDHLRLKEADVTSVRHNMEVWEPRLFPIICPGKAKYVGRERWMERLVQGVEVFGEGRSTTGFVVGVELMPPHGFKSEDEGLESYLEGCKWMHEHRVLPSGALLRPVPGAAFEGMEPPRTEYFLRVELARHKLDIKYGKAPRPGRPSCFPGLSIQGDLSALGMVQAPAKGAPKGGPLSEVC